MISEIILLIFIALIAFLFILPGASSKKTINNFHHVRFADMRDERLYDKKTGSILQDIIGLT